MRERRRRRLRKAWDAIKQILTFGKYAVPDDRVRDAFRRASDVAEAIDPHDKALRDEYGVGPDVPREPKP